MSRWPWWAIAGVIVLWLVVVLVLWDSAGCSTVSPC